MRVVERFVQGKSGAVECEDAVVVTAAHAAVVDGATDMSGIRYPSLTGGQLAAAACVEAIQALPADADAGAAVVAMTDLLASRLPVGARPAASVAIYSARRRQVWQVGDGGYWWPVYRQGRGSRVGSSTRSPRSFGPVLAAYTAAGSVDPATSDPGREAIMPLLVRQGVVANRADSPYGFA